MIQSPHPHHPVAIRDAATVAVLRDGPPGQLEVLLLRRHHGHVFGAGADVFPGGAVDLADATLARRYAAASALPDGAWRMAAIRECFEEAGLLLAPSSLAPPRLASLRAALNAGRLGWTEVIDAVGGNLDLPAPIAFARWTTPPGLPKRYATRFYALAAPSGQQATPDGRETVAAEWVAPATALAAADAGRRWLMAPTRATLARLARYHDTAAALNGLAKEAIDDRG